jgi:lactam utilization protein B
MIWFQHSLHLMDKLAREAGAVMRHVKPHGAAQYVGPGSLGWRM